MKQEINEMLASTENVLDRFNNEIDKIWDVIGARDERVYIRYAKEENPTSAEGYIRLSTFDDGGEYTINFNMCAPNSPTNVIIPGLSVKTLKHRAYMGDNCEFGLTVCNPTSGSVKIKLYSDLTKITLYESDWIMDTYHLTDDGDSTEIGLTFVINNSLIAKLANADSIVLEFQSIM